jgi:hypothetical protein
MWQATRPLPIKGSVRENAMFPSHAVRAGERMALSPLVGGNEGNLAQVLKGIVRNRPERLS